MHTYTSIRQCEQDENFSASPILFAPSGYHCLLFPLTKQFLTCLPACLPAWLLAPLSHSSILVRSLFTPCSVSLLFSPSRSASDSSLPLDLHLLLLTLSLTFHHSYQLEQCLPNSTTTCPPSPNMGGRALAYTVTSSCCSLLSFSASVVSLPALPCQDSSVLYCVR